MEPCRAYYPCPYLSAEKTHCLIPRCIMKHVTIVGKDGEYAHDELSGRVAPWVTDERDPRQQVDERDSWYEEWSAAQMAQVDTYERVHGRVRTKNHARR